MKGTSDTEVLLEAWSKWGKESVNKLDGMFAFVIWDKYKKQIFGTRDRIVKSLFTTIGMVKNFCLSVLSALFTLNNSISKDFDNQALHIVFLGKRLCPCTALYSQRYKKA